MKQNTILWLVVSIFFLVGCGKNEPVQVSAYDEKVAVAEKAELAKLAETHGGRQTSINPKDPDYNRYVVLYSRYRMYPLNGNSVNVSGTVDLKNNQLQVLGKTIAFERNAAGQFKLVDGEAAKADLEEKTLLTLITKAKRQDQARKQAFWEKVRKTIWLPIVLYLVGIFAIVAPEKVWYVERGMYYKNAEPSDAALFLNRASGVFSVILATILLLVMFTQ